MNESANLISQWEKPGMYSQYSAEPPPSPSCRSVLLSHREPSYAPRQCAALWQFESRNYLPCWKTPTVVLEPMITKFKALRSADCARQAGMLHYTAAQLHVAPQGRSPPTCSS
jgi:hypothetical protein